ncbi:NAD-dependent succinate-semialdehyde dehydrogenase [Brevibacterium casei]|uniref:NAD-dependent succinate-semialdehyde dehydrogenase n=1 Tax=Brevibacterium casei TaxID=33889 RepID=UPI00223C4259|nr:NAD-dependent succinate-semialdehyde dehydrogenase [Brevibacterium casei]MCT1552130.1 NAD-dependent succinate-semialdehyde dehydrogenase [Brevibacterium casei]MCT1561992.1 NAD-dependent succinate-semialdehyde dehydrogenase [Brevibacterium casei]MCT2209844.1 NAD-dependent succinate-semialdehyde dehydrogenase [Brevibacterium casei]
MVLSPTQNGSSAPTEERIASVLAAVPRRLLIDGRWRSAATDDKLTVTDPSTGRRLLDVADARASDGIAALTAAASAFPEWSRRSPRERSDLLRRAYELLLERDEDFALLIALEMGKPFREAQSEVEYAADFLRWFSEEAVRLHGRSGLNPAGTGRMSVTRHPVGPCFLVTPWNFPLAMATRKLAPALASGCTAVIKPAEATPLTTLLFASLLEEAGAPPGVVNVIVTSRPADVSEPIIRNPRLRKLSFTGSTGTGRRLMEQAAPGVLRLSMELGGNAPFLVFEDADLDAAVIGAMQAKFRNTGQACTAANRFFVQRGIAEGFVARIAAEVDRFSLGAGIDPNTDIGPLIDARAVEKVDRLIGDAIDCGAELMCGTGPVPGDGTFYSPTVLTEVPRTAAILREEIFGPVLPIVVFDEEAEAVELANDTEYGLAAYAFTTDLARGQRMVDSIEAGMIGINTGAISDAAAPFGGWKQSGLGREGGVEGIEEYTQLKYSLTSHQ